MMNAKRSNIHTAWKYGFLLPVLLLLVSVLNEPMAQDKTVAKQTEGKRARKGIETEGNWFATIKGDKLQMQFRGDDDDNGSMNGSTFPLADFGTLPRGASGNFRLKRDAGTMEFTGKFDDNAGMGRYKFVADPAFAGYLKAEGIEAGSDRDQMLLFFVNVTRNYISDLKAAGYKSFDRDDLIPLAALNVDAAYIRSIREAGLKDVSLGDLIPLRSLGVDKAYVEDIRKVYPNVDAGKLITLKAQGIDSKFVQAVRSSGAANPQAGSADVDDLDEVIEERVTGSYKQKIKTKNREGRRGRDTTHPNAAAGKGHYTDSDVNDMVALKALNVTDDYVQAIRAAGFPDIRTQQVVSFKALGITPEYISSLRSLGFTNIRPGDVTGAKSLNVTADFIRSFEQVGLKGLRLNDYISFKALGVTAELVKQYGDLGFSNLRPSDITGAKATGTTPAFVASMQQKGYKLSSLHKYIELKTVVN
ncbi:MAG: hypothetical protein EOO11_03030 [Chitinophagaceae bacterium]|nr:MAG: hypothetical protein EOO11_03030 [Chitinophagaceae bacterium]